MEEFVFSNLKYFFATILLSQLHPIFAEGKSKAKRSSSSYDLRIAGVSAQGRTQYGAPTTGPAGPPASSVNDGAKDGEAAASQGIAASLGLAGLFTTVSAMYQSEENPEWTVWAGFAIQAASVASQFVGAAGEATDTGNKTNGTKAWNKALPNAILKDPNFQQEVLTKALGPGVSYSKTQAFLDKLNSKNGIDGIKIDPNSGKLVGADGKPVDFSGNGSISGASIAAANLKATAMAKKVKEALDAYNKKRGIAMSEDGGAGGKGLALGLAAGADDGMGGLRLPGATADAGANKDARSVAGLSKDYHGEPIGVAADSLFDMMKRRYKLKVQQNTFFDEYDMSLQK